MKRLVLCCVMCAFAFVANAQVRKFYYTDSGYWIKVDLNKKTFLADGCGSEADPISNYKKAGNRETFTTYNGGFTTHHEIIKTTDTDYTYIYWRTPSETIDKTTQELTTIEPSYTDSDDGEGKAATGKVASKNPLKSVSNGAKGLFNKGKGLFKKDKGSQSGKSSKASEKAPVDDGSMPEK